MVNLQNWTRDEIIIGLMKKTQRMERNHETHISTEQIEKSKKARVFEKNVDEAGKKNYQETKGKRKNSSLGVISTKP